MNIQGFFIPHLTFLHHNFSVASTSKTGGSDQNNMHILNLNSEKIVP